jgi:hypothetical protein
MKPRGGARDVFFFRNGHKISQVSEFHDGVSIATKHDEQTNKVLAGIEARRLKFISDDETRLTKTKPKQL